MAPLMEEEAEEEAGAPGWPQWWERRRSGGKMRHQWRKRGRSGDAQSPHQLWLLTRRCHISSARKRADGTDDEKPHCCRTKNLTRPAPALDFGWRRRRLLSRLMKGENCLESPSPLPWPCHLESWRDLVLLERVWFLHPHFCLKQITL